MISELNDCIRVLDLRDLSVSTLCGSLTGQNGLKDGLGEESLLNFPYGLVSIDDNTLIVSEFDNHLLRKVEYCAKLEDDSEFIRSGED